MLYSVTYESPLGRCTLASDGEKLLGLWLEGQKYYGSRLTLPLTETPDCPVLVKTAAWLDSYLAGERPAVSALPLGPIGSAFQQAVWRKLLEIPYGEVTTYGALARQLAAELGRESMSAQAVGGAVGHNPISIIIPCHRVVGVSGQLTGYAGGVAVKAKLLALEGVSPSAFTR